MPCSSASTCTIPSWYAPLGIHPPYAARNVLEYFMESSSSLVQTIDGSNIKIYQNIHNKHFGSHYVVNPVQSFEPTTKPAFLLLTLALLIKKDKNGLFTEGCRIKKNSCEKFSWTLDTASHKNDLQWLMYKCIYIYICSELFIWKPLATQLLMSHSKKKSCFKGESVTLCGSKKHASIFTSAGDTQDVSGCLRCLVMMDKSYGSPVGRGETLVK